MLIPDLLNILFDQCDYPNLITLKSLNKRQTNYAHKYSILREFNNMPPKYNLKMIKHMINNHLRTCWAMFNYSAINNHMEMMKYLVENDECVWRLTSIINVAARNGNLSIMVYLHSRHMNVDECVLLNGVIGGNFAVIKYLMENNAKADYDVFMACANNGNLDNLKYVIGNTNELPQCYKDNMAERCAELGNLEMMKYLIDIGADERLHLLRISARKGYMNITKYLINKGIDVFADDNIVLKDCVRYNAFEMVEYLISIGGDVNVAFIAAAERCASGRKQEMMEYLVSLGADIHIDDEHALKYNARYGYLSIVEYLVSVGANVDRIDLHALNDYMVWPVKAYLASLVNNDI